MKVKIIDLLQMQQGLGRLFQRSLPAKLQYYVARDLAKINDELEPYRDTQKSLADEHGGELKPETQRFEFEDEDAEATYQEQIEEIQQEEIEVDLSPLKLEWLEGLELLGPTMMAISDLIEE